MGGGHGGQQWGAATGGGHGGQQWGAATGGATGGGHGERPRGVAITRMEMLSIPYLVDVLRL